ncbi:ubiquinol-cytochrome c reductase iron-sulfur subunit [Geotalea sp. SG265]|uniref:QcrA and Rieske domain-containing protein n=1 Tax=Geotalea sp. SG265 TaxID=2922867 RepID=UPI001FAF74A6|nr:ubiquinol-cytochrome c reductase iron-sulfur subunit [Geotalea sp. SG265]
MEKLDRSRRQFIITLISLLSGLFLLRKFLVTGKARKKVLLSVAKADIPPLGALVYRQSRVAVIGGEGPVTALSLVCTHLGCTVTVTPQGLTCPCHGSAFDRQGRVLKGPADRPLVRLPIEDRGDHIVVLAGG